MFKKKNVISIGILIILSVFFWLFLKPEGGEKKSDVDVSFEKKSREVSRKESQHRVASESGLLDRSSIDLKAPFFSPIDFWGMVVDEANMPIQGASVSAIIFDDPSLSFSGSSNTRVTTLTQSDGSFEFLKKKGMKISVKAEKEGYTPSIGKEVGTDRSRVQISYFGKDDNLRHKRPTSQNPTVLVLRKKNPVANLARASKKRVPISKAGDAQEIELATAGKNIRVKVRCWSSSPVPFTYDRYDWRTEIKVAGGKLQPITELEPVTAPTEGYQQVFQVEMPKDTQNNWLRSSPNGQRGFWVQFDDGTYAKARIEVKTGRKHEVDAEVWYNLDGTNNFEQ